MPASEPSRAAKPAIPAGGQPLPARERVAMERRLGADLGSVRLHSGAAAAASAGAVGAAAFTYGEHVVFNAGHYAPHTAAGAGLLMHELTHVIQQRGAAATAGPTTPADSLEREADRVVTEGARPRAGVSPLRIARQPLANPPVPAAPPTQRTEFERDVRRLGITVRTGTRDEQAAEVNARPGAASPAFDPATWSFFDPGPSSPIYAALNDALVDFGTGIGLPPLDTIVFLHHAYRIAPGGRAVPDFTAGSELRGRTLFVYDSVTRGAALPSGRSTGGAATALQPPTVQQGVARNVTRELARGLVAEAQRPRPPLPALAPSIVADFARAVGWIPAPASGGTERLLDVGQPINRNNWSDSRWVEQPLTWYMTDNPGDDFAEAVAAYGTVPDVLRVRSPRRHSFLDSRRHAWAPALRVPTPPAGGGAAPGASMTRAQFESVMRTTYGVTTIVDGTYADQQGQQVAPDTIPQAGWTAWNATPADDYYAAIVRGMQQFVAVFGAIPVVRVIRFFTSYWGRLNGVFGSHPVGASFGGGELTVYRAMRFSNPMATARSVAGTPTATPTPSGGDAIVHNVVHELGHGLESAATSGPPLNTPPGTVPGTPAQLPPDANMMRDYRSIVGWLDYHPTFGDPVLLDGGAPIDASNWTDSRWVEQVPAPGCLSGPEADLIESLSLLSTDHALLRDRSPVRLAFLNARRSTWTPVVLPPERGDYPTPREGDPQYA